MSREDWVALAEYDAITEVHVSKRRALTDRREHAWARGRAAGGVPLVLECTMYRMTRPEAEDQLALLHVRTLS